MALYLWASTLYEERTLLTAGDVVASVPLAGGGEVQVAAQTTLTAVVRKAARASRALTLPARFAERPADGTVVGSAAFRADGVSLGTVGPGGRAGGAAESAGVGAAGRGLTGGGFAGCGAGVTDANGAGRSDRSAPPRSRVRPCAGRAAG